MMQINLLPDIKLEYLRAQQNKRIAVLVSILVTSTVIIIVAALFSITLVQSSNIKNLSKDIEIQGRAINGHKNLDDILTIKNQIQNLNMLHQQEPAADRVSLYLNELIPSSITVSSLNIDFNGDTMVLQGNAPGISQVNQLVDTLKFAQYSEPGQSSQKNAFSSVVLTSFGINNTTTTTPASYDISLNFDPTIFNNTMNISLIVPNKVTTRSQLDQPIQLFKSTPQKGGI